MSKSEKKARIPGQLNDKQARFAQEYLTDLNAAQAAIRAGYSQKTARAQGSRLLTDANVQALIAEAKAARAQETGITQERILRELARLAFADPRKFYRGDGTLKEVNELDADEAAALQGVDVVERLVVGEEGEYNVPVRTKKVRWADKRAALRDLLDHVTDRPQKVEITGKDGGPVVVYIPDNGRE